MDVTSVIDDDDEARLEFQNKRLAWGLGGSTVAHKFLKWNIEIGTFWCSIRQPEDSSSVLTVLCS